MYQGLKVGPGREMRTNGQLGNDTARRVAVPVYVVINADQHPLAAEGGATDGR